MTRSTRTTTAVESPQTNFTMNLADSHVKIVAGKMSKLAAVRPAHGHETILIVDDDEGVAQTFARMLKLEGYRVRTAMNAENGLREAAKTRPAAIILDLRMPIVDGLAFLRRLRSSDPPRETPVAIVTGDYFLDDAVSMELKALGAELKFKPLWLEDLVDLTRTLLETNRAGRSETVNWQPPTHGQPR
jgi:DNA-binding NtrC family response regulator